MNRSLRELILSVAIFENSPARDNLQDCARRLLDLQQEWPLPLEITPELQPWAAACERGFQCMRFKNWVGAQAAYEEALTYRVGDAFVHQALGFSFIELGEIDNAVRAWLRALELDSHCDFTHLARIQRTSPVSICCRGGGTCFDLIGTPQSRCAINSPLQISLAGAKNRRRPWLASPSLL